ncbi:colanic acid/biofilm transcriptional regulator [Clostridium puniceum]|uniref:Colanic acid/biofilm transcriptional regulator n=1 Tax=Clostridium puniceum TaxID=29367 RepID=A0A1S8TEU4_9CLOT|nr:GntR family transcriptional regulator [Clostridium puniceum]OOM75935.1 colanic acid/biofilm transcriptional regulator [Clostridium puniceum]
MAVLKKQSLVDQIYEELKRQIIELRIPLGNRLNVSELQEKFGVSSTPIREAINRLQKDGIVEYENNIGARVITLSPKDVQEIIEVDFALQTGAIRYAMEKGNNDDIAKEIKECIDNYKKSSNKEELSKYVTQIMDIFYKYADNSRLTGSANIVHAQQAILRNIFTKQINAEQNFRISGIQDFIDLYEAVKAGDEIEAMKAIERNNFKAKDVIIKGIEELNN